MSDHTARLIITIIFLILAFSSAVTFSWFSVVLFALLAFAVGYPFLRGGKLNLFYNDPQPVYIVAENSMPVTSQNY